MNIKAEDFLQAAKALSLCANNTESRGLALTTVNIETDEVGLTLVSTDGYRLTKIRLNGLENVNYPGYQKVMPEKYESSVLLDRGSLLAFAKAAGKESVTLEYTKGETADESIVKATSGATSSVLSEKSDVSPDSFGPIQFNAKFLAQILAAFTAVKYADDFVKIEFLRAISPARLTAPGPHNEGMEFVLMPQRA